MLSDTDGTTTTGSRKSKIFRITFDVVLISCSRCHPESLVDLFS